MRCQPMVKERCRGKAALPWAGAGLLSPAPHDPREGCRARLLGRSAPLLGPGSSPVLWQTPAARRLSLSRCIPDLAWSSLSGDFPGEPALGTRLAVSRRSRVKL